MAQELADHWESHSGPGPNAGERVPQVVQANVIEVSRLADAPPRLFEVDQVRTRLAADDDVRIARHTRQAVQDGTRLRRQVDRLGRRLAIRQADEVVRDTEMLRSLFMSCPH